MNVEQHCNEDKVEDHYILHSQQQQVVAHDGYLAATDQYAWGQEYDYPCN